MSDLPFVDRIEEELRAGPEAARAALERRLAGRPMPAVVVRLWGLEPDAGFRVAESRPGLLRLEGRHRFSRYTLTFELGEGRVAAITHAAFPGVGGRLYRLAVISSGGHRIAVRGLLRFTTR